MRHYDACEAAGAAEVLRFSMFAVVSPEAYASFAIQFL
jgi:hypothetical protein